MGLEGIRLLAKATTWVQNNTCNKRVCSMASIPDFLYVFVDDFFEVAYHVKRQIN